MSRPILILGATSAIAAATAAALATRGHDLFLAGRDAEELERLAADLTIRTAVTVNFGHFDALDFAGHADFVQRVIEKMGGLYGVVLAVGILGDQDRARHDFAAFDAILAANFRGAVSILMPCAEHLEAQGNGRIIAISSVAGDRGRASNYSYGAAKGGLSLYLQGLRARLHAAGVRVVTVKPGFVDTAMTFGKPGGFLVASPEAVGGRIAATVAKPVDVLCR